jgi:hypothetical protein
MVPQVAAASPSGRGSTGWAIGTASTQVSLVRAILSGGRSVTARPVGVGGERFLALAIPKDLRPVSVGWCASSGHEMASESSAQIH